MTHGGINSDNPSNDRFTVLFRRSAGGFIVQAYILYT